MNAFIINLINKFKNRNNKYYKLDGPSNPFPANEKWFIFTVDNQQFFVSPYKNHNNIYIGMSENCLYFSNCMVEISEKDIMNSIGRKLFDIVISKIRMQSRK